MDGGNAVDLKSTIAHLEEVELQLLGIDADDLDPDHKNQLAEQVHDVSMDLTRLRNADLQNLSDAFLEREPELRLAAGKLGSDLRDLTDAVEIIKTVSAAMGTMSDIVGLLKSRVRT